MRDQPQVGLDHRADAGAPDLEDDRATVAERRPVHLCHRRGGKRLRIERCERGFGRFAKRFFDRGA